MTKKPDHSKYYSQDLPQTWTYEEYERYTDANWSWHLLPFSGERIAFADWDKAPGNPVKGSIIEIGSACGRGYEFLAGSNLVDVSDFHGYEISDFGIQFCGKKYPDVDWVKGDFTKTKLNRRFDYGFERHAIHHMPDPLAQYAKVLERIDKSFATTFVSCINGDTISNLDVARYKHPDGDFVYFDIINPFQIMEIGRDLGFNHFDIFVFSEHEPVECDPLAHQYISPDVNVKERMIGRASLVISKTDGPLRVTLNSAYTKPGKMTFAPILNLLNPIRRRNMEFEMVVRERIKRFEAGVVFGF